MKRECLLSGLVLFMVCVSIPGSSLSFNGYYKSYFLVFDLPEGLGFPDGTAGLPIGAVNQRIRFHLFAAVFSWCSFETAYDFAPRVQDASLFSQAPYFTTIEPTQYRLADFKPVLLPKNADNPRSFALFHNLDRFTFTFKTSFADLILGRQAVAWGSSKIISPSDVIAPFAFNELDIEERRGVDALRLRVPLGMMDELDIGIIAGDEMDFKKSAFFLKSRFYLLKTDISLLLAGFQENLLCGLDMARSLGGAGIWLEAAYVRVSAFAAEKARPGDHYWRLSAGMDYSFSGTVYTFLEYHFNGPGRSDPAGYLDVFSSAGYRQGTVYLLGRHYISAGIGMQITPLLPFNGVVIVNASDMSAAFAPSVEYNISENIYLSAGAYVAIGKSPFLSASGSGELEALRSEFGAYPDMFYSSFRIYF